MTDALFDVSSETVVITGANGQLGREYARAFAERGAKVIGLDLAVGAASDALTKDFPDNYRLMTGDITKKPDLEKLLSEMQQRIGTPTVLVNNAALDSPPSSPPEENGAYEEYPEASWDKVIEVNLKGTHLCCQVFGGAMAKAGGGAIVNIASIYGVLSPDQSLYNFRRERGETFYKPVAYSASKGGIPNLTRYLAVYWAKKNVRVNSLTIAGVFNHQEQAFLDAYCGRIPVGRMASATEYNGVVLFLASKASAYMTGSNVIADGGWTSI